MKEKYFYYTISKKIKKSKHLAARKQFSTGIKIAFIFMHGWLTLFSPLLLWIALYSITKDSDNNFVLCFVSLLFPSIVVGTIIYNASVVLLPKDSPLDVRLTKRVEEYNFYKEVIDDCKTNIERAKELSLLNAPLGVLDALEKSLLDEFLKETYNIDLNSKDNNTEKL